MLVPKSTSPMTFPDPVIDNVEMFSLLALDWIDDHGKCRVRVSVDCNLDRYFELMQERL